MRTKRNEVGLIDEEKQRQTEALRNEIRKVGIEEEGGNYYDK